MQRFDEIERHPDARTMRQFRVVVLVGGLVTGGLLELVGHATIAALCVAALAIVLVTTSWLPGVGRWSYVAWMAFGLLIGRITSPVILALVWLLFLTPLALLLRLSGRDAMQRRLAPKGQSYWKRHAQVSDPTRYFRQF